MQTSPSEPAEVEAMLERVVPVSKAGEFARPGGELVATSPVRAMRQHAQLAIRRINAMTVDELRLYASSPEHMQILDERIRYLSQQEGVGAARACSRLIMARSKMMHKLLMDAGDMNVRALEAEGGDRGPSGGEGFTAEQAIRMLSDGSHLKVTKTESIEVAVESGAEGA
jgi:hypothetical protein